MQNCCVCVEYFARKIYTNAMLECIYGLICFFFSIFFNSFRLRVHLKNIILWPCCLQSNSIVHWFDYFLFFFKWKFKFFFFIDFTHSFVRVFYEKFYQRISYIGFGFFMLFWYIHIMIKSRENKLYIFFLLDFFFFFKLQFTNTIQFGFYILFCCFLRFIFVVVYFFYKFLF